MFPDHVARSDGRSRGHTETHFDSVPWTSVSVRFHSEFVSTSLHFLVGAMLIGAYMYIYIYIYVFKSLRAWIFWGPTHECVYIYIYIYICMHSMMARLHVAVGSNL